MRIANPIYDVIFKYLMENDRIAKDLFMIQIPKLAMVAQTEFEELLDVFNVKKYKTNDKHVLEYTGVSTNPKVKHVVKHLNKAIQVDEIIETMKMEDEYENAYDVEKKAKEAAQRRKEELELRMNI